MLKHIDPLLTSELLFELSRMGHGDRVAIVDANFPAVSHAQGAHISLSGIDASSALSSLLKHVPLDSFTDISMWIMASDDDSQLTDASVDFIHIQQSSEEKECSYSLIDRQTFYAMTQACQLVISTKDMRPYACVILQKGVIFE